MPTWSELRRYLRRNGWELWKSTHHDYYRKVLPDGNVLQTRVSHGSGEIPPNTWKRILKKQLRVSQEDFNRDK